MVRGQLHSPMGKLVMRVAHVAPIRARCFNSKRTSFHVALELEHVESVDLRSAIRKADAVLPAFAREGQRGHTVKRVARRGRCRLLFLLGVQHIVHVILPVLFLSPAHRALSMSSRGANPGISPPPAAASRFPIPAVSLLLDRTSDTGSRDGRPFEAYRKRMAFSHPAGYWTQAGRHCCRSHARGGASATRCPRAS